MLAVETTQFILVRSQISPTLKTDCSIDFIDNDYELDIGLQRDRLTQHRPRPDRLRLEDTERHSLHLLVRSQFSATLKTDCGTTFALSMMIK